MRAAAAMTVLVGAGLLAGHALAQSVGIPTVPTVTVAAPTVAVPLPTIPKLPPPAVPAPSPVTAPSTPVPVPSTTPSVPAASSTSAVLTAPAGTGSRTTGSGGSAGSPSFASSASGSPRSNQPRVERLRSSRRWIATSGPNRRRVTTLTFVLPRAARVVFVIRQVSPVCRIAGHFAVNGHAGRNRIRFPSRGSNLQLDPGTYRITARTRAGQVVQRVTIVVVEGGAPTRDQIIAARASNVCTPAGRLAAAASGPTGASNTSNVSSSPQEVQRSFTPGQPSASGLSEGGNSHSGAVLASSVEKAARAVRPVLVALLALAIVLLGIASLPRLAVPESRANELLARHRIEIAGLGTAAFVAVVIAFLVG